MLTEDEIARITGEADLVPLSELASELRAQMTWHIATEHDERACAASLVKLLVLGHRALTGLLRVPLHESAPPYDS